MNERFIISFSGLKSISFIPAIRSRIEDHTWSNLRALLEDDPKVWLEALNLALDEVKRYVGIEISALSPASESPGEEGVPS